MAKKQDYTLVWIIGIIILLVVVNQPKQEEMVGLNIHYYKSGVEVFPPNKLFSIVTGPFGSGEYDQIAFDISGTNIGENPIKDIKIIDAYPQVFKDSLSLDTFQTLAIGESKILWTSELMDTIQFESISPVNFWIEVSGIDTYENKLIYSGRVYSGNISFAPEVNLTPVYLQEFYIGTKELSPEGVFFKSDGTKMYTVGEYDDTVDEYNLGTPWSVVTAVYLQELYVGGREIHPQDIFFKSDGTKMYIIGNAVFVIGSHIDEDGITVQNVIEDYDTVNEYNLLTPWSVVTAVHSQEFYVGDREACPTGLFFKSDGTKMYTIGSRGDTVDEYDFVASLAGGDI